MQMQKVSLKYVNITLNLFLIQSQFRTKLKVKTLRNFDFIRFP